LLHGGNTLPREILDLADPDTFKRQLKAFLFDDVFRICAVTVRHGTYSIVTGNGEATEL